jgi:hypothetical protein
MMFFLLPVWQTGAEAQTVVRYPVVNGSDPRLDFPNAMLMLALEKSVEKYGPYRAAPVMTDASIARRLQQMLKGQDFDVVAVSFTADRDRDLLRVPIPIDRGLLGYRVLLVREAAMSRFAGIRSVEDLRQVLIGQGDDWPDAAILRDAGMKVVTTQDYYSLFRLLSIGRIEAIGRSVIEAVPEMSAMHLADQGIAIEERLLLVYPLARYFYVRRSETALAERLREGLLAAVADGSFSVLFQTHPAVQSALADLNLSGRRIIELANPETGSVDSLDPYGLWFRPGE